MGQCFDHLGSIEGSERKAFLIALAGGFNYDAWSNRAGYVRASEIYAFFEIARSLRREA